MILDLFAGPGGWSEGLRMLGLSDVGVEFESNACATRAAAGHTTIQADIRTLEPITFLHRVELLIASPPCQAWSVAGKRKGFDDPRGQLVYEVIRWAQGCRPRFIACEQVPPVLKLLAAVRRDAQVHRLRDMVRLPVSRGVRRAADP